MRKMGGLEARLLGSRPCARSLSNTALRATKDLGDHVSRIMKIQYIFHVVVVSLFLSGCASQKETMVQSTTDQTQKRVHTQEELRKTGQSETGPALERSDAAVRMSNRP